MKTHSPSLEEVGFTVHVATGRKPASILFKNATILNVFSLELEKTHLVTAGRLIAGIGDTYENAQADRVVDLEGAYLAPGLIDGHVHIESSLVTPATYAAGVLPRGVTGVVCDPHEIGNVSGVPGIEWLLKSSDGLDLDVWVTVPSCVPSTPLETSGAVLGLSEIEELLKHPRVVGVAEIMSFPDIIAGDEENLSKALLAERYQKSPEGHAPALSGADLQAYFATGIASDHEATTLEEGREKLHAGVFLMVREGSVTRNLDALMPLVQEKYGDRIGFVTDDRLPHDLLDEGGVDCLVRASIKSGVNPTYAVRCASYNVAKHYRLTRRGALAPGYFADMVVLNSLEAFTATDVYKEGKQIVQHGNLTSSPPTNIDAPAVLNTVTLTNLTKEAFKLPACDKARCIKPIPYQVLTEETEVAPTVVNGEVVADTKRDLLKLVCVERHGHNGNVGAALVAGFGLTKGALAVSVGHDHHNIMAVGCDDDDLLLACKRLEAIGGGFIAVSEGSVLAELALPIAGLVTSRSLEDVRKDLDTLEHAASELGNQLPAPFMTLSFLGLAVIPELRLTDRGLVDVNKAELVSFIR